MSEPAASLTDLALGLAVVAMAVQLRRAGVNRSWERAFWWAGAAALAGAVHHGVVTYSDRWSGPSWAVISGMVVITISYSLAASVHDVLGPGRGRVFWALRSASLVAYGVLALTGRYGIGTILICEGVTMVSVLVLWAVALGRGHPRAPAMVVALAASIVAGCMRAIPSGVADTIALDPTSLYHLAQIPAMWLLWRALGVGATADVRPRHRVAPAPEW